MTLAAFAVVKSTSMQDGAIEVSLSGDTVPDAPQDSRGFVEIAFRVENPVISKTRSRSYRDNHYKDDKNGRPQMSGSCYFY